MDDDRYAAMASALAANAEQTTAPVECANLRLLRDLVTALGRGDLAALMHQASPDVTLRISAPPELPFVRQARGIREFTDAMRANFDAIAEQRPVLQTVCADADLVMVFGRETGRVRATGLRYALEFVERFAIEQGRLVAVQIVGAFAAMPTAGVTRA